MKICIIGPGLMPIPPVGWGAVEQVIHGYANALANLGWEVDIVNTQDSDEIVRKANASKADVVHCHYDQYAYLMRDIAAPIKVVTPHFGYASQVWGFRDYLNEIHKEIVLQHDLYIFALSAEIRFAYISSGVPEFRVFHLPNGTDTNAFKVSINPRLSDRCLCLGKIEPRKRQGLLQSMDLPVDFVGDIGDASSGSHKFDVNAKSYLGKWSREQVRDLLTEYGNLILLSDGEAHPLVCIEALSAGLGVLVSKPASANLDTEKRFITIIPDERLHDSQYIRQEIEKNRRMALSVRTEIVGYANSFSWSNIIDLYTEAFTQIERVRNEAFVSSKSASRKVAIVTIATGAYFEAFFSDFYESLKKAFPEECYYTVFCITDAKDPLPLPHVVYVEAKKLGWPFDTLLRYYHMSNLEAEFRRFDNVIFMDSDMLIVSAFDDALFEQELFAVEHPGYWKSAYATFEVDAFSSAYTPPNKQKTYVQGCFFGGKSAPFCYMVSRLNFLTWKDLAKPDIPIWHDESFLNWFCAEHEVARVSMAYAFPEGWDLDLSPKVIHRRKNSEAIRGSLSATTGLFDVIIDGNERDRWCFYRDLSLRSHEKNQRLSEMIAKLQDSTVRGLLGSHRRFAVSQLKRVPGFHRFRRMALWCLARIGK